MPDGGDFPGGKGGSPLPFSNAFNGPSIGSLRYNTSQAGYDDYRPLAVFITDPASGKVLGGLYGGSYLGQLRVDRFFLPEDLRRDRLGSRLLAMAERQDLQAPARHSILTNTLRISRRKPRLPISARFSNCFRWISLLA